MARITISGSPAAIVPAHCRRELTVGGGQKFVKDALGGPRLRLPSISGVTPMPGHDLKCAEVAIFATRCEVKLRLLGRDRRQDPRVMTRGKKLGQLRSDSRIGAMGHRELFDSFGQDGTRMQDLPTPVRYMIRRDGAGTLAGTAQRRQREDCQYNDCFFQSSLQG